MEEPKKLKLPDGMDARGYGAPEIAWLEAIESMSDLQICDALDIWARERVPFRVAVVSVLGYHPVWVERERRSLKGTHSMPKPIVELDSAAYREKWMKLIGEEP